MIFVQLFVQILTVKEMDVTVSKEDLTYSQSDMSKISDRFHNKSLKT